MEDHTRPIESLLESAAEYGKTSYKLAKLKALDKTSDVVSSLLSHYVVIVIILAFLLFLNLGLAIWLGEILGKIYFGFFAVAVFWGMTGILAHFILHKWLKRIAGDHFIKRLLK